MYSIEDLARAIVKSLEDKSFPNEVAVSELFIPGTSERHLRLSVYDAEDEHVDQLESELYDLVFALEKNGYPGRALVSVYRRDVSPEARVLPPEALNEYVPSLKAPKSDAHSELFKRLLRQPFEEVAVPRYINQGSLCRHPVPPQLLKVLAESKDDESESSEVHACRKSVRFSVKRSPDVKTGVLDWKERNVYLCQGRAA